MTSVHLSPFAGFGLGMYYDRGITIKWWNQTSIFSIDVRMVIAMVVQSLG